VFSAENHLVGVITARDCCLTLSLPDTVREYWQDDSLAPQLPFDYVLYKAMHEDPKRLANLARHPQ